MFSDPPSSKLPRMLLKDFWVPTRWNAVTGTVVNMRRDLGREDVVWIKVDGYAIRG